jgi:hypothetical protein
MRRHASYFKPFIDVAPVRRAPRRRVAANSRADLETHSESEIDKAYEHRLQRMQNSGVFGDNLEIQAFAREFGLTVKIYQRKLCLAITADNQSGNAHKDGGKVVHIAYHHVCFPPSYLQMSAHVCKHTEMGALFFDSESNRSSYGSTLRRCPAGIYNSD